jgi:hypothetical protein
VQPLSHVRLARGLEERVERFLEVRTGLLDRLALAGDIDFRRDRHKAVTLSLDDRGEFSDHAASSSS